MSNNLVSKVRFERDRLKHKFFRQNNQRTMNDEQLKFVAQCLLVWPPNDSRIHKASKVGKHLHDNLQKNVNDPQRDHTDCTRLLLESVEERKAIRKIVGPVSLATGKLAELYKSMSSVSNIPSGTQPSGSPSPTISSTNIQLPCGSSSGIQSPSSPSSSGSSNNSSDSSDPSSSSEIDSLFDALSTSEVDRYVQIMKRETPLQLRFRVSILKSRLDHIMVNLGSLETSLSKQSDKLLARLAPSQ